MTASTFHKEASMTWKYANYLGCFYCTRERKKTSSRGTNLAYFKMMAQPLLKVSQVLTQNVFLKKLKKVFNKFDQKITIEFNLTKTDFLDAELDLINNSYAPLRKPNFQTMYVSVKSNHPRYVVNQIPKSINKI